MKVIEIDLEVSVPHELTGIVMMHSDIEGIPPMEPYCWSATSIANQLKKIERTLTIAKTPDNKAKQNSFIIFPEYSLPGEMGINIVDNFVTSDDCEKNTIVIGGVDSLDKSAYEKICNTYKANTIDGSHTHEIAAGTWVNCFVLWAKDKNGNVKRFVQTKTNPAWPEQNISCERMHKGSSIFLFKCKFENGISCRFLSLICFDWITKLPSQNLLWQDIFHTIESTIAGDSIDLNWIFILQENRKPNDQSFLNSTREVFEGKGKFPRINPDYCAIVLANNAKTEKLGNMPTHGYSSVTFSGQISAFRVEGSPRSYSGHPTKTRNSDILGSCHDVIFRENGSCIHSFSMYPPKFVAPGKTSKRLPIAIANVHAIDDKYTDPRATGAEIAGAVKWVNDEIDALDDLGKRQDRGNLKNEGTKNFQSNSRKLGWQKGSVVNKKVIFGTANSGEKDIDKWNTKHTESLKNILDGVSIFQIAFTSDINSEESHASIFINEEVYNLIFVKGTSHLECVKHCEESFTKPAREGLIIVTKDEENTKLLTQEKKITEKFKSGPEAKFTEPTSQKLHIDFSSLLNAFNNATSTENLKEIINELLKQ